MSFSAVLVDKPEQCAQTDSKLDGCVSLCVPKPKVMIYESMSDRWNYLVACSNILCLASFCSNSLSKSLALSRDICKYSKASDNFSNIYSEILAFSYNTSVRFYLYF